MQGQNIFRYDTFGDEIFWTGVLKMNEVVQAAVDPITALTVAGLKVDSEALPTSLITAIQNEQIDLTSPATTVALIGLDAVVGIKGTVEKIDDVDTITRLGVTQMGGQGFFADDRTGVVVQNGTEDLITKKLPALQAYQLSLLAPEAPEGSFNVAAAARGMEGI